jgi:hypothetical protein
LISRREIEKAHRVGAAAFGRLSLRLTKGAIAKYHLTEIVSDLKIAVSILEGQEKQLK